TDDTGQTCLLSDVDPDGPPQLLVTTIQYSNYVGKIAIGRLSSGALEPGQVVAHVNAAGETRSARIGEVFTFRNLKRESQKSVHAGSIVAVTGIEQIGIGDTITDIDDPRPLPPIDIEQPTVRMTFSVNTSPFAGRAGRYLTSRQIHERLILELEQNVALRVADTDSAGEWIVSGRGELHLAILIETMRREGYEFHVSRPEVILKTDQSGKTLEPFEEVHIETSPETVGVVIEKLSSRRGELQHMIESTTGTTLLTFIVPSRGMLGFRHQFLTATRGLGIMNTIFQGYAPSVGAIATRSRGSLVAWEDGTTTTFALKNAEERGTLFVAPGTDVYCGMVVGEYQRPGDLD
ncbi:MAG: translational GTPase TypA, partial [Chloroflexi bacterium]|nr:translational GTPase TypA [Chloroflexota bacterium]